MKIISPKVHAVLDYIVVLFLFSAPFVFNFGMPVTIFTIALAFIHLFMTLITDFPGGMINILALRIHGLVELAVSVLLMIFAFVADFDQVIELYFYIAFSAVVFITWVFTDYDTGRRDYY